MTTTLHAEATDNAPGSDQRIRGIEAVPDSKALRERNKAIKELMVAAKELDKAVLGSDKTMIGPAHQAMPKALGNAEDLL